MPKRLFFTLPLGILAKDGYQWIGLRSKPQICSNLQKLLNHMIHNRSNLKWTWIGWPIHGSPQWREGSLSPDIFPPSWCTKPHCNSACKKDAVSSRNYADGDVEYFGLMPRSKLKIKQWLHSSRRLKDTLTEKRLQYKLDLDRSRGPIAAAYKSKQTLSGSA